MGDNNEYIVEVIKTHIPFEIAFKLRKQYINFNPYDLNESRFKHSHSKYVYEVKWEGYPESENTWEPEDNLLTCSELAIYKKQNGMRMGKETIHKQFDFAEPLTNYTEEELYDMTGGRVKKPREGSVASSSQESYTSFSKTESTRSKSPKTQRIKSFIRDPTIRKRKSKKSKLDREMREIFGSPNPASSESSFDIDALFEDRDDYGNKEMEIVRWTIGEGAMRQRRWARDLYRKRRCTSAERLTERWQAAYDQYEQNRRLNEFSEKMVKICRLLTNTLHPDEKRYRSGEKPLILHMRANADKTTSNKNYWKVVGPSVLKSFLKENKVPMMVDRIEPSKCSQSVVMNQEETNALRSANDNGIGREEKKILLPSNKQLLEDAMIRADSKTLECMDIFINSLNSIKKGRVQDIVLQLLWLSYAEGSTKDVRERLTKIEDKEVRQTIIQKLVAVPRIPSQEVAEKRRREGIPPHVELWESDLQPVEIAETTHIEHCSEGHWKCRMMHCLMSFFPATSFMDETAPFNTFKFVQCMRYGALCQKKAFLIAGVPLGIEFIQDTASQLCIDHVHIAAIQTSLRSFIDFLRHGFDINSTAFSIDSTGVEDITLKKFISARCQKLKSELELKEDAVVNHLHQVEALLNGIDERMEEFMKNSFNQCMMELSNQSSAFISFQLTAKLTPVHTLKVVPFMENNEVTVRSFIKFKDDNEWNTIVEGLREARSSAFLMVSMVKFVGGRGYQHEYNHMGDNQAPPLKIIKDTKTEGCKVKSARLEFLNGLDCVSSITLTEYSPQQTAKHFYVQPEDVDKMKCGRIRIFLEVEGPPCILITQLVMIAMRD